MKDDATRVVNNANERARKNSLSHFPRGRNSRTHSPGRYSPGERRTEPSRRNFLGRDLDSIFKTVEKRNEQRRRDRSGVFRNLAYGRNALPRESLSHFAEFTIMLGTPSGFKAIIRGIFVAGLSY